MNKEDQDKSNNSEGIPTASLGGAAIGPGEQIGPYKLLRILGEGGYGIVYLAERQRPVKRRVALKVIKPGMDTKQVIARFEAERQALALLDHPNIAHVFNAGTSEAGRPYFAMEYVKGVPITEHCDRYKLTIEERLKLFLSVCEAIQHAHQKAIIHRDLKPSNILVAYEAEQAIPMIIDFGVAKALSQSLTERTLVTEQAQMVGTPEYMSPEQAEMTGQDIDTRTDVYSLGVLLYELLTGTLPFDSQTLREGGPERMRQLIRQQDPRIPSAQFRTVEREQSVNLADLRRTDIRSLERRLHGELDWITLKAMDKDRTHRYQTAYALAEDIQRYLNQEPVLAGPPSTVYKLRKFVIRNKGLFVSTALIVGIIILAAVVSIGLAIVATKARNVAETLAKQQKEDLYFNHIKLAHQELNNNRPVRALDLLEKCPKDLQNWEWRYLYRKCHSQGAGPLVFDANVISFDFNPDGSKLAAFLDNGKLVVRDRVAGKESSYPVRNNLEQLAEDYVDWLSKWVAFCPDGKHIVVAGDDYAVNLISLSSGETGRPLIGHTDTVSRIVWHPDGQLFATLSEDNTIGLWNRQSDIPLTKLEFDTKPINLIFNRDGRYLIFPLIGFGMQWFRLEDILNGKTPKDLIRQSPTFAMGVAVSPNDQHVTLGQWEGTILLSNGEHTEPMYLEGHASMVFDLTFNANVPRLASISDDQTVRLWDISSGREILVIEKEGPFSRNIAFSQDGNQLIVNDRTNTLMVLDASPLPESQDRTSFVLKDQRGRVQTVKYSPSGKQVISSGESGVVFWNAQNGEPEHTLDPLRIIGASNAQFSPDGRWITATFFNSCRVFDAKPPYQEKFLIESNREMYGVTFSYDSRYLIVGGEERILHVYDCQTGTEIGELGNQDDWILSIIASRNGKYLASTGYYYGVQIWDATRLDECQEGRLIHRGSFGFVGCGFSPDEKQLAVGGLEGQIRVLDVESEATVLDIPNAHGGLVHGVTFSHNGKYIASCSADETVRIWDAKTGNPVDVLLGHNGRVLSVDFSPDGKHVVSGGVDQTIRIWRPRLK